MIAGVKAYSINASSHFQKFPNERGRRMGTQPVLQTSFSFHYEQYARLMRLLHEYFANS